MKRNTIDRQVIKAITIGISASMALQPVVAYAETVDGGRRNWLI